MHNSVIDLNVDDSAATARQQPLPCCHGVVTVLSRCCNETYYRLSSRCHRHSSVLPTIPCITN